MAPAPKRATKEEVRARYHGIDDHARSTGWEAAWIGLQGVSLAALGAVFVTDTATRVAALVGAVVLVAAAIGVVRAAEWARWTGGVASLLLGVVALALPYVLREPGEQAELPKYLFAIMALVTGAYLLSPSTAVSFRAACEMRDRVSATKARA